MKAHVAYIGDYDEQSKTYGIGLIVEEAEIVESSVKAGDDVEIILVCNKMSEQKS